MKNYRYKNLPFYAFNYEFEEIQHIDELGHDSTGWRLFYATESSNWILFYPLSDATGAGTPYIIRIDNQDFYAWLDEHPNFEEEIRTILMKRKLTA